MERVGGPLDPPGSAPMRRRPASWRHPALAPVYAAVIAFGAVLLANYLVHLDHAAYRTGSGEKLTVTVEVTPASGAVRLCLRQPRDWQLDDPAPTSPPPGDTDSGDTDSVPRACRAVSKPTTAPFTVRAAR